MRTRTALCGAAVAAAVLMVWGAIYLVGCSDLIYHPRPFGEAAFDRMAAFARASGAGARGTVVVLPQGLAGQSATGRMYVTGELLFVPAWVGRRNLVVLPYGAPGDDWVEGYLYSSKPLTVKPGEPFVMLNVPSFCRPWAASDDTGVQMIEMYIEGRVGQHWYKANSFS